MQARQFWRAFAYVMHLHENHSLKRAGVAGLRARACTICGIVCLNYLYFEEKIDNIYEGILEK